ncbi:unnamed protein product, partial [marine sediment metagenome]
NKTWAGSNNANCKDLTLDPLGNIYITGDTTNGVEYYITFLKYDKYGSLLLNKTWGTTISGGQGIVIDSLNNAYIAGSTVWYDGISSPAVLLKYSEISPESLIHLDIVHHSYSSDEFEFIFFIYNETGDGIDFATVQMWWDGTDVSGSVLNLGGGSYIVTLDPITVSPTDDPILLNMTISASGYDDRYYEAYFAVDPEVIDKTIPDGPHGIPGYNLFYIFGILSVLVAILLRKKIKK